MAGGANIVVSGENMAGAPASNVIVGETSVSGTKIKLPFTPLTGKLYPLINLKQI
jgi:hypothetical protein